MHLGEQGGCRVKLSGRQSHLWLASIDALPLSTEEATGILSEAERERAGRFRFQQDRHVYVGAHYALRSILSRYLSRMPEDIVFLTESDGKPRVEQQEGEKPLYFNLSHSGVFSLIGVSRVGEIGVDIESIDPSIVIDELADRVLTSEEMQALAGLDDRDRRDEFYRLWCGKEALLKAEGIGLRRSPATLDLDDAAEGRWPVLPLRLAAGYAGAVALPRGSDEPVIREWPPTPRSAEPALPRAGPQW